MWCRVLAKQHRDNPELYIDKKWLDNLALTTGTFTDLTLSRHIEKESSFVYNSCKKGGYYPMNVNRIYFDKNRSLELKGVAIMLMLFHHCFRLQEIYKGYNWCTKQYRQLHSIQECKGWLY